jgi:hypothetical protein
MDSVKSVSARQAQTTYEYKNTKEKPLEINYCNLLLIRSLGGLFCTTPLGWLHLFQIDAEM